MCLNIMIYKYLVSNQTKMLSVSNCHPLEIVSRGSETQLQVGENLNRITQRLKG